MKIIQPLQAAVLVLLVCSSIRAADGPALLQLRTKLPVPGDVLIEYEDPSSLIAATAEGSASEVVAVEPSGAMAMDKAVRVRVTRTYETTYGVQIMSDKTRADVHKGDVLLLSCFMRAPEAAGGQSGVAAFYLQTTDGKWDSAARAATTCGNTWKQMFAEGTATTDYPSGGLQVAIHLSQQKQVIDLAGLVVLDLGPGVDPGKLPRQRIVWQGMEADAPWRAEAQKRIEEYRMATLQVQVLDATGKPVANASVHVRQQSRAFTIGSFAGGQFADQTPDGQKLRETFLRLFNRATTPIYWADWGWPNEKPRYLATAKWLADHHFTVRGHCMVYPTFRYMPADVVKLKDDPEQLRKRILQQIDEISQATKQFGFREYDVTNELRDCREVYQLLGRDAVAQWYAEARRSLPDTKLALSENTILTNGGATQANQDLYLDWYRFLKSKGQAPDVLGFQGHFSEDVTAPETVLKILDRFAKETTAELQITEFDFNTLNEEAQAAYTRDFLTICFSHPRITGFNMWGFWQGDQWLPNGAFYRKDWSPKPNGKMLEELLTKTWWTDTTVNTDKNGRADVLAFMGTHGISATVDGKQIETTAALNEAGEHVPVILKP